MNTYLPIFRGLDARGGRKLRTDTHTHTHTNTRDNYSNPRCAHARRGLIKDDIVNKALHILAIYVGEKLLHEESLLLPAVHKTFSIIASDVARTTNVNMGENEILVPARWLLSHLIVYLQHHLSYACRIKKHRTLLYRSNGDLLTALSNSLYKGKLKKDVTAHVNANMEVHPTHHADEINALILKSS